MTLHGQNGEVMRRAWALFRETYSYPCIPFSSIGRRCFVWALRTAWAEARAAAELATLPIATIDARLAAIELELDGLKYRGFGVAIGGLQTELRNRARPLTAELFRRSVSILKLAA